VGGRQRDHERADPDRRDAACGTTTKHEPETPTAGPRRRPLVNGNRTCMVNVALTGPAPVTAGRLSSAGNSGTSGTYCTCADIRGSRQPPLSPEPAFRDIQRERVGICAKTDGQAESAA
jgi:hypothetical protein